MIKDKEQKTNKAEMLSKQNKLLDEHNLELQALTDDTEREPTNVLPGGILSKYGWTLSRLQHYQKKKREQDFVTILLQQMLNDGHEQIQQLLQYYEEQLEIYQKHIEDHILQLQQLSDNQSLLKQACKYYEQHGRFERDKNGELKDKELDTLLKEWERKTGQTIPIEDTALYYTLLEMTSSLEKENHTLQRRLERDENTYETYQIQYDKAQQIADDLKSNNTNTQLQALEQLEQLHLQHQRVLSIQMRSETTEKETPYNNDFIASDFEAENLDFGFPDLKNNFSQSSQKNNSDTEENKSSKSKPTEDNKQSSPTNKPNPLNSKIPSI